MQTTSRVAEATPVPFLDLAPVHAPLRQQILDDLGAVIDSGAFVNGSPVAAFEEEFAAYCGTRHCVGTASGLDALRLALLAAEVGPGDEVIVPAMTFAATVEAVTQTGARPVLADVREDDFGLDPTAVATAVTSATRFVMPVHLYGQMADVSSLEALGVPLLEDACQAHGATRDDRAAGSVGVAGAFSFYPGKNLGAMGDAGALVTSDDELAARVRALREHGQERKYEHRYDGYTARLDTVQAAVLRRKLPRLDNWNQRRLEAAEVYTYLLEGVGDLRLPQTVPGATHAWHLYTIRTADPDRLAGSLRERGIATGRHYPVPMHLCPAFAFLGHGPGDFPVAEAVAAETLSLPLFPGITPGQLARVVDGIVDYFEHG